ncbi:MAG: InlB B-repeat-containing protein [Bacteroidales bacterium]|nr:InlB B-repeat-containing protein [Bacteroidales bacterium]
MKDFILLCFATALSICSTIAQDYNITFAIPGSSNKPTSVKVENITQGTDVTLAGNDVLNLVSGSSTGIIQFNADNDKNLRVYPNPVDDNATILFNNPEAGMITLRVININGTQVTSINSVVPQGEVSYNLTGLNAGSYVLHVQTANFNISGMMFSGTENTNRPHLSLNDFTHQPLKKQKGTASIKAAFQSVKMQYDIGDILKFTASIDGKSVVNDNYVATKDAEIEFLVPYTITYHNIGNNQNVGSNPTTYTYETTDITLSEPSDSTGFTFGGWYTDAACTDTVGAPVIAQGSTGNKAFYAKWVIFDIDGNMYTAVNIGSQIWMQQNLRVTRKHSSVNMSHTTDEYTWRYTRHNGYCWYNNDSATYAEKYGAIYNGWVAIDDDLCPVGWHVPTLAEWDTLLDYAGGESIAGNKLKESDTTHWSAPNTDATNELNFTALPGGLRSARSGANFGGIGEFGYWWTSTKDGDNLRLRRMSYEDGEVDNFRISKQYGHSVRCIRD